MWEFWPGIAEAPLLHCQSPLGVFPGYWLHAKNLIVEKNNKTGFLRQRDWCWNFKTIYGG
jgi:hypothetical protein